ncbi:MAG: hypothetical protein JO243_00305 [Solirubrobacterales bacterium]|nr:hypothetical protein [Solirubrobacterales bacterium]
MTTPIVRGDQTNNNDVGERIDLGRYRTAAGVERVLYGQRVAAVVRFLPGEAVVFVWIRPSSKDGTCDPRRPVVAGIRPNAVRQKRRDGGRAPDGGTGDHREVRP